MTLYDISLWGSLVLALVIQLIGVVAIGFILGSVIVRYIDAIKRRGR